MNYTQIINAAFDYSDRARDVEVSNNIDTFLRVVESRINRRLDVREMHVRTQLTTTAGQEYYGLPIDFKSMRDIEYKDDNATGTVTLEYLGPKQANDIKQVETTTQYYTIIADQLQIVPAPNVGTLEIVYARKLLPLTATEVENWLSVDAPDVYIFGLCTEISAFAKDAAALAIWDGRFTSALDLMYEDDASSRWSGTPLRIRLG